MIKFTACACACPASEFQSCLLSKQKINFIVLILILCITLLPVLVRPIRYAYRGNFGNYNYDFHVQDFENTNVWPRSMQYSGKLGETRGNSGKLGETRGNSGKLGETRGNSGKLGETPALIEGPVLNLINVKLVKQEKYFRGNCSTKNYGSR